MARKPADILAASPKPVGRDGVWAAIRKRCGAPFSIADIHGDTDIPRATIRDYLSCLKAAGIVNVKTGNPAKFQTVEWRLIRDPGADAPRVRQNGEAVTQGLGNQALWRTIKILGSFTPAELALAASTKAVAVKASAAQDYLKYMLRAGYVRRTAPRPAIRYSFVRSRDPGPLPPQIQRVKQVFDPNSKTVVWPAGKDGAA